MIHTRPSTKMADPDANGTLPSWMLWNLALGELNLMAPKSPSIPTLDPSLMLVPSSMSCIARRWVLEIDATRMLSRFTLPSLPCLAVTTALFH
jgi:hypothetical protein